MELNRLEENKNQDDQGPFLSPNVKDIFKRRKEEKNKKTTKKMNLKSLLPSEDQEINTENNVNNEDDVDNDNEKYQMISQNSALNNEDNITLEKNAKKNYKTIFNLHKNYDINFNNKTSDNIKKKKNKNCRILFKELFFLCMNIIAFIFFVQSFVKRAENDQIYYYLIYPITKSSFVYLLLNSFISSLLLLFIFIKLASIFHIFYSAIFYMIMFYKYHLTNNNTVSINYFDPAYCHFFVYIIILLHILFIFHVITFI